MEDESEIIKQVKALITETDQVHIDITLNHQEEIKAGVINDVNCTYLNVLRRVLYVAAHVMKHIREKWDQIATIVHVVIDQKGLQAI